MDEKRRYPRLQAEENVRISFSGASLFGRLLNISADGAAVEVANAAYIPKRFRLVMESGQVHDCRLVWIKQNRIGVAFDDERPIAAAPV
ncbi:PilZ domain-containing protein [Rhodopseudomonas palustris]|uniref:PilZ domain-containing protein n=1 Tax=Rhodopseudomonas palustris TaxID=1076 RepID=UPI0020CC9C61|nr:PilZ domain-containing protein [Rhodopseudomonas palustris]